MSFSSIAAKYNEPLEAAHALIDDRRNDVDGKSAERQGSRIRTKKIRDCSIASEYTIRLRSANEL